MTSGLSNSREINNDVCGGYGCTKEASIVLKFPIAGFSACFCEDCADDLIENNSGVFTLSKTSKARDLPPLVRAYDMLYPKQKDSAAGTEDQSIRPAADKTSTTDGGTNNGIRRAPR